MFDRWSWWIAFDWIEVAALIWRYVSWAKTKIVGFHTFSAQRISDGKQSGVNESSLDDRKIYGRDGWAERASIVWLGASNPWPCRLWSPPSIWSRWRRMIDDKDAPRNVWIHASRDISIATVTTITRSLPLLTVEPRVQVRWDIQEVVSGDRKR